MNPQDILNSQYTAPDLPDVSQVHEALRTVREHVARNKTPYALLAASLPVIGYGAHRAMRKTPEADAEPSLHAGPATTHPAEIQQGGDKIAQAVLARFGLGKVADLQRYSYVPGVLGGAARWGIVGGLGSAGVSAYRQRNDPNIDWDRVRKSALQGAGVGAAVGGAGGALATYAGNHAVDALNNVSRHLRETAPAWESMPDPAFDHMYQSMANSGAFGSNPHFKR